MEQEKFSNDGKVVDFTKEMIGKKTEIQTLTGPKSGYSRSPGFLVDACISVANLIYDFVLSLDYK